MPWIDRRFSNPDEAAAVRELLDACERAGITTMHRPGVTIWLDDPSRPGTVLWHRVSLGYVGSIEAIYAALHMINRGEER